MTQAHTSWPTWARIAVPLTVGLIAIGCGGDDEADSQADTQPYIDATVAAMDDDDFAFEAEQAECMATTVVEAVGVDRLEEEGIDADEFAEADSFADLEIELDDEAVTQMGDDLVACDMTSGLVAGFAAESGGEVSDASVDCIVVGVDEDELGAAMAQAFVDGDDPDAEEQLANSILTGVAGCPDAITELIVNGIEEGSGAELSSDGQACVAAYLEAHPEDATQVFAGGGEGSEDLGEQLGLACAEHLGG